MPTLKLAVNNYPTRCLLGVLVPRVIDKPDEGVNDGNDC